jgi:hypothetical protein
VRVFRALRYCYERVGDACVKALRVHCEMISMRAPSLHTQGLTRVLSDVLGALPGAAAASQDSLRSVAQASAAAAAAASDAATLAANTAAAAHAASRQRLSSAGRGGRTASSKVPSSSPTRTRPSGDHVSGRALAAAPGTPGSRDGGGGGASSPSRTAAAAIAVSERSSLLLRQALAQVRGHVQTFAQARARGVVCLKRCLKRC